MGLAQGKMASPGVCKLGAELEWLESKLGELRATISDAEQKQTGGKVFALSLQEMKDFVGESEDLIDEFVYEELRRRIEGKSGSGESASSLLEKVNEIKRRFLDIEKFKNGLGIGDVDIRERTRQSSSFPTEPEIFGRKEEKEEIIRFLQAPDDDTVVSTIAIAGMGGIGKTTVAQLVYNDRRVVDHFNPRMWVCTAPDYDIMTLTREILGSIDMDMEFPWGLENLDVYHSKIVEKLEGKQFLLVLDNMWDRDQRKWQCLLAPLRFAKKGSKILITTRDTGLAKILQSGKTIELGGLPFHHCWMLFKNHAFFAGDSAEHPRLKVIGKQIVDKFKGVPLAAAVTGDLLHSTLEESEWRRILESEMWEIEKEEDGILSVLKLSYERLPPRLKQCIAYCSLFPKNYRFEMFDLVQRWMAEGFLQTERGGRVEDVGIRCFNDLFNRSFFQLVDGEIVVHDLIHDLALLVSHCDHLTAHIDGLHRILRDNHSIRHLSLLMTSTQPDLDDWERLLACRRLRTLAFHFPSDSECQIPDSLFLSLNTLRVLDLSCGGVEMLPDSIGNLRHLRYLNLKRSAIKYLPESLCCLYELQTLKLRGCYEFWKLPQGISKLINLRHLDVDPGYLSGVVGIGNLTCLQELESFPISEEGNGPKIDDLKAMNELRGTLCIQNLQWVRSKEEAMGAMLDRKRHLLKLEMEWKQKLQNASAGLPGHRNSKLDDEILEALVPPAGLKEFVIRGYDGEKAPRWLVQQSLFNLESISLNTCRNWRSLPVSMCMSSLRRIHISGCPQLRHLPSLPATLKELVIYDVGLEELPEFYHPAQPRPESGNSIIPSLSILEINCCGSLKSLQGGLLRHHLKNLTVLRIQHCYQLVDWPKGAGFLATLLSLHEELCIEDCPRLEAFPAGVTLSPSLKHLVVTDSPDIVNKALLAQLNNFSSEISLSVEKDYTNLASCYDQSLHLICAKERVWSWRCDDWVHAWRVQIWPRTSTPKLVMAARTPPCNIVPPERRKESVSPCSCEPLLPWASSVRWLAVDGIFHGTFLPFKMPSLEGLWISRFRVTVPLLPDDLLSHLPVLMELQFFDCPELTLSSLKEMISSLPSLLHLTIERCPKLTSSSPMCTRYAATSSSIAATLQTLFVDDAKLLGNAQFVRDCLSSLCGLHIWYDRNLTSFTTTMEEGLRSLGRSLQHLSFNDCDKLDDLPSDMPILLPSLKALSIRRCKKLCYLPMGGLPALLDILVLHHCGGQLEMQCNAPPSLERQAQQQTYWPKIAHIPVIVNNGCLVQGSYREFLELREKWRDF